MVRVNGENLIEYHWRAEIITGIYQDFADIVQRISDAKKAYAAADVAIRHEKAGIVAIPATLSGSGLQGAEY